MAMKLTKVQEEIKDSLDALVQILEIYGVDMQEAGREYLGLCPFHDERTPSFRAYQKEGEPALYKCFGCQANGNVFQFVQTKSNISFPEAAEKVASLLEWEDDKKEVERTFHVEGKKKKEFVTFPVSKLETAKRNLAESEDAIRWLGSRAITLDTAKALNLGFVQSVEGVDANHPWCKKGWIIFPVIENDKIISLKYRSIFKKKDGGTSGFLRAPGMETRLFNEAAVSSSADVFLVEGEMDVLALTQAGYISVALPSAGFNLTASQRANLLRANRIFLAGDMDTAGQETMNKLWVELRDRTYKIDWPEPHKDANDVLKAAKTTDAFKAIVEAAKKRALSQPIPYVFNLRDTLRTAPDVKAADDPGRMRFPWPSIDNSVVILPSNVVGVMARETKIGKTSWVQNILLHNAMKYNKVILNYGVELSPNEYATRVACQLTKTPREQVGAKERNITADLLENVQFYNGWKPGARYQEVMELLIAGKKNLGADIIVVDTLHFITSAEGEHETAAQNDFMRRLKEFASEYNCIVIVVNQPNKMKGDTSREATGRDVKGSEALASTANYFLILDRKRIKSADRTDEDAVFDPVTTVKLDYGRDSKAWVKKLYFDEVNCLFVELAVEPKAPSQSQVMETTDEKEFAEF